MKTIQIMGPGCAKCAKAAELMKEAAEEAGVEIQLVKITEFKDIASYGVFSTPAVAINGEVKVVGRIPDRAEALEWVR